MGRIITLLRNINYLMKHSLWEQREEDIVYLTNKILDDGIYEYGLEFPDYRKLDILEKNDSIDAILQSNKSFVRMGDGEIRIMQGIDQPFQQYEPVIAENLVELLKNQREDILVGVNRDYYVPHFRAKKDDYNRRFSYDFRKYLDEHCNFESTYIDGACTFNYVLGYSNDETTHMFWKKWKDAFKEKKLVIICGEKFVEEMTYNIFDDAESIKYIYGPRKNAWDQHDELIKKIKNESKDNLLIFILGMAGKAMIPEVTDMGYTAWDIGHLAKGYNAYRTGEILQTNESISSFYAPD